MKVRVLMLLAALSWPAHGDYTGSAAIQACDPDTDPDSVESQTCRYYVGGFLESLMVARIAEEAEIDRICPPVEVSWARVQQLFHQYLVAHPEAANYPAAGLLYKAMAQAWPCK